MNISVCFFTQAEFGCLVEDVTITSRLCRHRNTSTHRSWMPRMVTDFTEKKSTAHRVFW